jgi:hypothetical protein
MHRGIEHRVGACRVGQRALDEVVGRHADAFEALPAVELMPSIAT